MKLPTTVILSAAPCWMWAANDPQPVMPPEASWVRNNQKLRPVKV